MSPKPAFFLSLLFSLLLSSSLSGKVKLPSIVSDGMVLQRDPEINIWGWADPGEEVTVSFRDQRLQTTTAHDGRWQLKVAPLAVGGPHSMYINGGNHITVRDVFVGDVWVCSGQSNMTHDFARWQERYAAEIAASENPQIRQFYVPGTPVLTGPRDDLPGLSWKPSNPENLLKFTVIGYFFAKKIYDETHVPQGIIMSCVGGTPIEAWTSEAGFRTFPDELAIVERNKDTAYVDRNQCRSQGRSRI
ncbi:MAG: hypothetical protein J6386_01710 [Candidatus Synoicihabitans palmerolidicus]|nr:hypothetical protein [Candidatus Synoicihabitans palmerolidicus]